jgi:hypothetical protein
MLALYLLAVGDDVPTPPQDSPKYQTP